MWVSDAQHSTASPAHHTPICPANLGECPEAPVVPATLGSPRAGQGSSSLGSAHPGAEGPPSSAQPGAAQPSGAAALRRADGHLRLSPRGAVPRQGSPPVSAARTALSSRGGRAAGKRERGRTAARVCTPPQASMVPPLSGSGSGCALAPEMSVQRRGGYGEKWEAAEDARLGTERPGARQHQAVPWHAGRVGFWEM